MLHEVDVRILIACCKGTQDGVNTLNLRGAKDAKRLLKSAAAGYVPIPDVELNLHCRDRIVPVLRALQHVYSNSELTDRILALVAADINRNSRTDSRIASADC